MSRWNSYFNKFQVRHYYSFNPNFQVLLFIDICTNWGPLKHKSFFTWTEVKRLSYYIMVLFSSYVFLPFYNKCESYIDDVINDILMINFISSVLLFLFLRLSSLTLNRNNNFWKKLSLHIPVVNQLTLNDSMFMVLLQYTTCDKKESTLKL